MSPQHPALDDLVATAARMLSLTRVVLFGSRARGDARPDSDIDIAVEHSSDEDAWAAFINEVHENAPTLLDIDLVDLRHASQLLAARIAKEGVTLYG